MTVWEWRIIEEEKALRALRKVVDNTCRTLAEEDLDRLAADRLMYCTRAWVLKVFPDKEEAYDMIYRPRFERIYHEKRDMANET